MNSWLAVAISAAFLGTWFLVRILVRKASEIGLVDHPNERSSHSRIMPRGGGIGFVLVWICGCFVWQMYASQDSIGQLLFYTPILGATIISAVSLWDDFRSVGVIIRFSIHGICSIACLAAFGWFTEIDVGTVVPLGLFSFFITVIWVMGLTNVFNFMDGIDGIAGLQGLVAASSWCLAGVFYKMPFVGVSSGLLAGGCAGFLLHNWSPAKIFMGDVGSAFLGFVFAVLPLVALRELPTDAKMVLTARLPVFAVLVVWPFLADGSFTFCRRLLKREPVWKPHRSHLYQRLIQTGWSHALVASYYGLWAIVCVVAGFFYLLSSSRIWSWPAPILFLVTTWLFTVFRERRNRQVQSEARGNLGTVSEIILKSIIK